MPRTVYKYFSLYGPLYTKSCLKESLDGGLHFWDPRHCQMLWDRIEEQYDLALSRYDAKVA